MFDEATKNYVLKTARILGVPPAALFAVVEVESAGKSLAKVEGRDEPLIRFEAHYFYKFLKGPERTEAEHQKLASPIPGRIKNPRTQKGRWKLLQRAIAINRIAALSSCSWGVGQVMGSHWKWLGFGSVDALVEEARSGVQGQIKLMTRYIDRADLKSALRNEEWAKFARVYNGPSYALNRYDQKIAKAFTRYEQMLTASQQPRPNAPNASGNLGALKFGVRGKDIQKLQKRLSKLGYLLKPDGFFGLVTDRVVRQFQRDHLLPENGIIGATERILIFGPKNAVTSLVGSGVEFFRKINHAIIEHPGQSARIVTNGANEILKIGQSYILSIFNRFN